MRVGGQRVGLALDDIGIATNDIANRPQHRLPPALGETGLHPIADQPGLESNRQCIALVRRQLDLHFLECLVIGPHFQKHRVGILRQRAIVEKRALPLVIAGVKLAFLRLLVIAGSPHDPWIDLRLRHRDSN